MLKSKFSARYLVMVRTLLSDEVIGHIPSQSLFVAIGFVVEINSLRLRIEFITRFLGDVSLDCLDIRECLHSKLGYKAPG